MTKTLRIPDEPRFVQAFALAVDPGDTLGLLMEIGALGSQHHARRARVFATGQTHVVRYDVLYHTIPAHGNPPPAEKVVLALADHLLDVHVVKVGVSMGQPQAHRPAVNAASKGVAHLLHPTHLQRRRVPRPG